jgi:hypothetical protein
LSVFCSWLTWECWSNHVGRSFRSLSCSSCLPRSCCRCDQSGRRVTELGDWRGAFRRKVADRPHTAKSGISFPCLPDGQPLWRLGLQSAGLCRALLDDNQASTTVGTDHLSSHMDAAPQANPFIAHRATGESEWGSHFSFHPVLWLLGRCASNTPWHHCPHRERKKGGAPCGAPPPDRAQ